MTTVLNRQLIAFLVPAIALFVLITAIKSPLYPGVPLMNLAVSIDLLLVIPLVFFLLIRPTRLPNTLVIPVMIGGLLLGMAFLPEKDQLYLQLFKTWALPVVELIVISWVTIKVYRTVKSQKNQHQLAPDFFNALKDACQEIVPKPLVVPFATEIAVFYYGFVKWRQPRLSENQFTYHRNSGAQILLSVIVFLVIVETFVFHILLMKWSITLAWILTGVSIYSALQVVGIAKSLAFRPIVIDQHGITLRYGILNETSIPFENLEKVELTTKDLEEEPLTKTLSPLAALEGHNVVLHLNSVSEISGLYGFKKKYRKLAVNIDDPKKFHSELATFPKIPS